MRFGSSIIAALSLTLVPSVAQAKEPLVLKPSSPWVVNYAEDSCRLIRNFGEGEQLVRLELRMYELSDSFHAVVSGRPFATISVLWDRLRYRFDPDTQAVVAPALGGSFEGLPALHFAASLNFAREVAARPKHSDKERELEATKPLTPDFDREAAIERLTLSEAFIRPVVLQVGSMRAPMIQMRACLDDLITAWGFDATEYKALSRRAYPMPNSAKWVRPSDYPMAMLRAGRSNFTYFKLAVNPEGKPTACATLPEDASTGFGKLTCRLMMKRAHFLPALDPDGKTTPSFYVSFVQWRVYD